MEPSWDFRAPGDLPFCRMYSDCSRSGLRLTFLPWASDSSSAALQLAGSLTARVTIVFAGGVAVFLILLGLLEWLPRSGYSVSDGFLWITLFAPGLSGSVFILTWPMARSFNDPKAAGSAAGFANMGGVLGRAIIPALFGRLLEGHKTGAFTTTGRPVFEASGYKSGFLVFFAATGTSLLLLLFSIARDRK